MLKAFLSESERGITPHTWWDFEFAGHNKEATLELKALFDGDAPFDTPKPVRLMRRLIELFCSNGDTVLDFFCGSAAFGHAAMECISASTPIAIRHILVQLPEPISRAEYRTIADVAKERLRRAAKKIKSQNPLFTGDLGFRVFKLDSSNIRAWEPDPNNLDQTILDYIENIKQDRSQQDILYELLLKLGLDLCVPIEQKELAGKAVHSIGGGVLMACLAPAITFAEVEPLAQGLVAWHQVIAPAGDTTCLFRDSAFADDVAKTNLTAILNQHGLSNVRSL